MIRKSFLFFVQEPSFGGALWQVKEDKNGKKNSKRSLNNEQPSPGVVYAIWFDLENPEGEKPTEGVGYVRRCVEYG